MRKKKVSHDEEKKMLFPAFSPFFSLRNENGFKVASCAPFIYGSVTSRISHRWPASKNFFRGMMAVYAQKEFQIAAKKVVTVFTESGTL